MSFSFPRNPIKYPFHTYRNLVFQPMFFILTFLSPVLHIFQLDVIHQQVVWLGERYPMNPTTLFWLPISFFGVVILIALISAVWGRLFCGWVCPHNTMTEWTGSVRKLIGIGQKSFRHKQWEARLPWLKPVGIVSSLAWALAITYVISTLFLFYFVPVEWWWTNVSHGTLEMVVWWGQGLLMLIGLFMIYTGHEFCKAACPYGLSQSFCGHLTTGWTPMEIRYKHGEDQSECRSCRACETICPVDIDPRKPEDLIVGIGEGCFNCGECIDACSYVRGQQDKDVLLRFKLPF